MTQYSEFKGYTNYEEMLEKERPDVVHICTPHYLHTEMIIAGLKRNINVLCEKPMCIKMEDIPLILAAEKDSNAQLGVVLQNRYVQQNIYVKEYLKDKKILNATGNVIWKRDAKYYRSGEWRGKWQTEGGGLLINQALHTLDLLQWFVGMPNELVASVSNLTLKDEIEVEDTASLVCYGKETGFTFFGTNASFANLPVEVIVQTSEGTVSTRPNGVIVNGEMIYLDLENPEYGKEYGKKCYGNGHTALIFDFYDCVEKGKKFSIDGTEAAKIIKIILAAYESQGKKVKIL